jgi:hypothetical protein
MHSRKILLIAGDFMEDYEVMAGQPGVAWRIPEIARGRTARITDQIGRSFDVFAMSN